MKSKLLFYLAFLIETVFLAGSVGVLATINIRVSIMAPITAIGSFFIVNKDIRKIFGCAGLEKIVMQFMLGVMELTASVLIKPLMLLLAFCDVISLTFANTGFIVVGFCLFAFSLIVIVISLFRMWICIFRMWRNNDYEY